MSQNLYLQTDICQSVSRLDDLSQSGYSADMALGERIKAARTALGWKQEDLARAAGVPQSQISDLERGKRKSTSFLPEIAQALKKRPADLDERFEDQQGHYRPPPQMMDTMDTMPVYSSAEGGEGTIIVSTDEIGRVPRPYTLEQIPEAYAILITGESMVPAYEPGDRAWVNPRLPPLRDTDCILYSVNELGDAKATIKRLLAWTDSEWTLQQHNPAKTFKLKRSEWNKCHRVVGNFRRQ